MKNANHKPNLLLIMCDQLRADVLGCYGNSLVKTPNIDALAKRGAMFENAYSQTPVCMPARYGLISGQNPCELSMWENGNFSPEVKYPLAKQVRTQGYVTCAVGKMHFNPPREHYGFERMYLSEEIPDHISDDEYLQFLRLNGYGCIHEPHGKRSETYYIPQVSALPEQMHTTAWTAQQSAHVIASNPNRPFFLFTSFIKPHPPFDPCVPYDSMYALQDIPDPIAGPEDLYPQDDIIPFQNGYKVDGFHSIDADRIRRIRAAYYGSISQIDAQIGILTDALKQTGLYENTLIILTADHGEMLGDHRAFGKRTYFEPSCRIPLLISGPGIPEGVRRKQLATLQDVYATLIAVAGGKVPTESEGVSLLDCCRDSEAVSHAEIFAGYGNGRDRKFMLRRDNFKYIYYANGARECLYDLIRDPNELHNIAKEAPHICNDCYQAIVRHCSRLSLLDCLTDGKLLEYPYQPTEVPSFLDQRPTWPNKLP